MPRGSREQARSAPLTSVMGRSAVVLVLLSCGCPAGDEVDLVDETAMPRPNGEELEDEVEKEEVRVTAGVMGRLQRLDRVVVEFGEYAKAMAAHGDVRAYADRLVRDHERIDAMLEDVAQRIGIDPVVTEPPPETRQRIEEIRRGLVRAGGTEIDRRFLWIMVRVHEQAIEWLDREQFHVHPEVRVTIDQIAPILRQHAELARRLLDDLPEA